MTSKYAIHLQWGTFGGENKKGSVKQRLQNAVEKILDLNLRNVSINTLLYVA